MNNWRVAFKLLITSRSISHKTSLRMKKKRKAFTSRLIWIEQKVIKRRLKLKVLIESFHSVRYAGLMTPHMRILFFLRADVEEESSTSITNASNIG